MDITELGDFLRVRRRALRPGDVGLSVSGSRRTPGLRREEVAMLAGISVDYYERLERAKAPHPSAALLADLARTLRLSNDELDYMLHLAGHPAPQPEAIERYVAPEMMFLLDRLDAVPAHIVDGLSTVVAQNELSVALFGACAHSPGREGNLLWRWFTDERVRPMSLPEERADISRSWVAELRATVARRGHDPVATRLVADLLEASAEFAECWAQMTVAPLRTMRKAFVHPAVGQLDVHCDMVLTSATGHRLLMLRPEPGSGTAERFELLHKLIGKNGRH